MTAADDRDPHLVALGAYLRRRARIEGRTDAQIATVIGRNTATVQRIHAGTVEGGVGGVLRQIRLVRGSFAHIYAILDDPAPSIEKALALAELPPEEMRETSPIGRLSHMLAHAAQDDPGLLDAVEGFIAGRRSGRAVPPQEGDA